VGVRLLSAGVGVDVLAVVPVRGPPGAYGAPWYPGVGVAVDVIGRSFLRRIGWIIAGALIFGVARLMGLEIPR